MKFILFLLTLFVYLSANSLQDIRTIKSDFTQTITNESNKTIRYSGKFYADADGKALWIYEKPIQKSIYYLNGKVVVIEPELEQAIFSKFENFPKILTILKSAKPKNGKLVAACCDTDYQISVKNKKIKSISYKDKVGNSVKITFSNQEINIILDDSVFRYKIPQGYDILKN
ncbi:MAG: outer membrane lipoprotein chaperone LolA [Epsilonproteobacteria bacterium]|nr:outer membrane lipoprotein chaperone LolA [Campylobacterota bacterium]